MKQKCIVEGCDFDHYAKGLCRKHYGRKRTGGDPFVPSRLEMLPEERFKAKLSARDPVTGCIEWMGYRVERGYGQIRWGDAMEGAHRVAYMLKHGPIPTGLSVLHKCDNPPCCNDEHLFLGTHADNSADMVTKGREAKGEKQGGAKLKAADVEGIRRLLAEGKSQADLASVYGVSRAQIGNIKRGQAWRHLNIETI